MLDIGRSPHVIPLCYLIIAIYLIFCSDIKNKYIYVGILVGILAINRESYGLYFFPFLFIAYKRKKIKQYLIGCIPVLTLFFIFILFNSGMDEYLNDMLVSGVKFRSDSGSNFFSLKKIENNLNQLKYGYSEYYSAFLIIAALGYFVKNKDDLFRFIKLFILPCAICIEILINKTVSYSIQPILLFSSLIIPYFLIWIFGDFILNFSEIFGKKFEAKNFIYAIFALVISGNINNIYHDYGYHNRVVKNFLSGSYIDSDPYRLLEIVNLIPHETIG